jgi:serine/threonine protein kinase
MASLISASLEAQAREDFSSFLEGVSPVSTEALATATLVGRQIGPYVIDSEVGRGGMGSVWRAHRADGRYDGTVAIKFVHPSWIGKAGEQRFQQEGRVLARLNQPNIARLLDAGVLDGVQPYLVHESSSS